MSLTEKDTDCGIARALDVIGGKWTLLIIRDLIVRPRRFGELEQSLSGISPRTLTIRLKELEADGVLKRDCSAGEFHPMYCLTEKGYSLQNILDQMRSWGEVKA
ncbi:MAG TPA: helix-turn-helix domain-containing protein [Candidatus Saccharimonadia bacterium]|nr:helix-turn-helix domain-containing protein [Candidatus Saccharimonadia bacterium]